MSNTRYLQLLGQSWYVRVKIPRALQGRLKNTHVRRALGTRDLAEANRRKWALVAMIHAQLARCAGHHSSVPNLMATVDPRHDVSTSTEQNAGRQDIELPQRLTRSVWSTSDTLDELVDLWLEGADYLLQTKQQHRQVYGELRDFLGGNRPPVIVTEELAIEYAEDHIKRAEWSTATKRRKLSSLIAFWRWLGMRRVVPRGFNPWTGFRVGSKKGAPRTKRHHTEAELC